MLEHNMAKIRVEVDAETFDKAMQKAYNKIKGRISIPGFRKGKASRKIVEKMYGAGVFYEDAAQFAIEDSYDEAARSTELDITSRPILDIEQIEEGKPFIYTAEVAVKPEVTLGSYDDIEVLKQNIEVTDKDIENELKKEQEKNTRTVEITDRAAEMGDEVVIDYKGTVDGIPFAGGESYNYTLALGSNSFIPGFEDQIAGKNIDEEFDVNVTFPEDYHEKTLAGKDAVFACKLHKITKKETPEIDDEFASDVSEFDTLEEYKEDIKKNILERKEKTARQIKETAAVDALVELSEMDIPDPMIESTLDNMVSNYARNLAQSGFPLDKYLSAMNMTPESFRDEMRPQAVQNIKTRLVLEAVAEKENIEVSDETVTEELKKMAEAYGVELDEFKKIAGPDMEKDLRLDLAVRDAVQFVADKAKEVDELTPKAEPEAKDEEEAPAEEASEEPAAEEAAE